MDRKTIEIIIDGREMKMTAKGFSDGKCITVRDLIAKMMGATVVEEEKKMEVWEQKVPTEVLL